MTFRVLSYGDRALLVEVGGTKRVVGYVDALRADIDAGRLTGVEDLVPAASTVLVVAAADLVRSGHLAGLAAALAELEPVLTPGGAERAEGADGADGADDVVTLPVRYDGPDLADVARLTGLSEGEVVAAHTGQTWRVAFGGFAPGFGYLVGEDDRLRVPRLDSARTAVPAGAVGLAGDYSGVYPRESPGGWQIIGRTDAVMWDLDRDPPALLRPGARVRFEAEPG
jgi:KipI family sensor histidine kinase inhibitor